MSVNIVIYVVYMYNTQCPEQNLEHYALRHKILKYLLSLVKLWKNSFCLLSMLLSNTVIDIINTCIVINFINK